MTVQDGYRLDDEKYTKLVEKYNDIMNKIKKETL